MATQNRGWGGRTRTSEWRESRSASASINKKLVVQPKKGPADSSGAIWKWARPEPAHVTASDADDREQYRTDVAFVAGEPVEEQHQGIELVVITTAGEGAEIVPLKQAR
jgi:hypothetical protein